MFWGVYRRYPWKLLSRSRVVIIRVMWQPTHCGSTVLISIHCTGENIYCRTITGLRGPLSASVTPDFPSCIFGSQDLFPEKCFLGVWIKVTMVTEWCMTQIPWLSLRASIFLVSLLLLQLVSSSGLNDYALNCTNINCLQSENRVKFFFQKQSRMFFVEIVIGWILRNIWVFLGVKSFQTDEYLLYRRRSSSYHGWCVYSVVKGQARSALH